MIANFKTCCRPFLLLTRQVFLRTIGSMNGTIAASLPPGLATQAPTSAVTLAFLRLWIEDSVSPVPFSCCCIGCPMWSAIIQPLQVSLTYAHLSTLFSCCWVQNFNAVTSQQLQALLAANPASFSGMQAPPGIEGLFLGCLACWPRPPRYHKFSLIRSSRRSCPPSSTPLLTSFLFFSVPL